MSLIGENGQLFGWAEPTWLWLDQFGIVLGDIMLLLSIVGGIWAWLRRDELRRWLTVNRFPSVGETEDGEESWPALVFTVSRTEVPEWVLDKKRPKVIALLASRESWAAAEAVARHARGMGVEVIGPKRVDDPDDPAESREEAARLIDRLRKKGHETVAVDVTGGKTPMSLGVFMAAEEARCATLYVSTRYDPALKKPDMSTAHIRCISRPVET